MVDVEVIIFNECPAKVSTENGPEIATNISHFIKFERVAFINGTKYSHQREDIRKTPGMAASPLLNIIGHDPKLSKPLLQRISNQNLEVIQVLKEEVKSAGTTDIWFAFGVGVTILIRCSILLILMLRRRRDAREIKQALDKLQMTEDDHTSEGRVDKAFNE